MGGDKKTDWFVSRFRAASDFGAWRLPVLCWLGGLVLVKRQPPLARGNAPENHGSGLVNGFQALAQKIGVSVPELDVVSGCGSGFKPDCLADHEGHSFSLGLADLFGGKGATVAPVQHLVTYVVDNISPLMWRRDLCGARFRYRLKAGGSEWTSAT